MKDRREGKEIEFIINLLDNKFNNLFELCLFLDTTIPPWKVPFVIVEAPNAQYAGGAILSNLFLAFSFILFLDIEIIERDFKRMQRNICSRCKKSQNDSTANCARR